MVKQTKLWAGIATIAWLVAVTTYALIQWGQSGKPTPNELGDFLAGSFSPVAFLWLILGYRQQGEELKLQAEELRNSVVQQRELVAVTRDQLSEHQQARRFEEERRIRKAQPRFSFATSWGATETEAGFSIKIQNHGADCTAVRLRVPTEFGKLKSTSRQTLAKGHSFSTTLIPARIEGLADALMKIEYRDQDAEWRSQEIELHLSQDDAGAPRLDLLQMDWEKWFSS